MWVANASSKVAIQFVNTFSFPFIGDEFLFDRRKVRGC